MIRRAALVVLVALLAAMIPTSDAQAGEADEILMGFIYGTTLGLLFSGAMLVFYTNRGADDNLETVLLIGGISGAAGGIVFGSLLPDDAVENDPIVSLRKNESDWRVSWQPPKFSLAPLKTNGKNRCGLFTDLFRLDF